MSALPLNILLDSADLNVAPGIQIFSKMSIAAISNIDCVARGCFSFSVENVLRRVHILRSVIFLLHSEHSECLITGFSLLL